MAILIVHSTSTSELLELLPRLRFSPALLTSLGQGIRRTVIVAESAADFSKKLELLRQRLSGDTEFSLLNEGIFHFARTLTDAEVAFVFPGQGSQSPGMLRQLHSEPVFKQHWDQSIEGIRDLGVELGPLLDGHPPGDLDLTQHAQPALAVAEAACLGLLRSYGVHPAMVAGHSFGELVALAAAGSYSLPTLLELSVARGELMARANEHAAGKMLAVVDRSQHRWQTFHESLKARGLVTDELLANINTPSQLVYSGHEHEILQLRDHCQSAGIRCSLLSASAAFHSPLMGHAEGLFLEKLRSLRDRFTAPQIEVCSSIPARSYRGPQSFEENLSAQLSSRVAWVDCIERMILNGARLFIEVGPKSVLTKTISEIHAGNDVLGIALDGPYPFQHVLGFLAALGLKLSVPVSSQAVNFETPTKNKVIKGFLEKQKELLRELQGHQDSQFHAQAERQVLQDTEEVLSKYFAIADSVPRGSTAPIEETVDGPTQIILEEVSQLTGFRPEEIKLDARFDNDLYLDSITRLELLSQLSARFHADTTDMSALLNANSVRDLAAIIRKYEVTSPVEDLGEELLWVRREIANYTGVAEERIHLDTRFSEDLMLDSLIKTELLGGLQARFPGRKIELQSFHRVNSLRDLGQAFASATELPAGKSGPERKFSKSMREGVAAYLNVSLDKVLTTSSFEHDLKMNIFEKEDFINSLVIKHPYLQLGLRELLHAPTVGDVLQLEKLFDRRSEGRIVEEEVVRYRFKKIDIDRSNLNQSEFSENILVLHANEEALSPDIANYIRSVSPRSTVKGLSGLSLGPFQQTISEFPKTSQLDILLLVSPRGRMTDWEANLEEYVQRSFQFAKSLELVLEHFPSVTLKILIHGTQNAFTRGLVGLTRSLTREYKIFVNIVDMPWTKMAPAALPWVLLWDKTEARRDRCRFYRKDGKVFTTEVIDRETAIDDGTSIRLPEHPHILLVGGARGITSEVAKFLAEHRGARISAAGRTPIGEEMPYSDCVTDDELRERLKLELSATLPGAAQEERTAHFNRRLQIVTNQREIWKTKASIESRGGEFRYHQIDAVNLETLRQMVTEVEAELGPISGIIHAAGITRDGLVKNKSFEDFREVVLTKVKSALNLYSLFHKRRDLSFVCFFSSLSSWSGAPGQTDYSLANEILNVLAENWNRKASFPVAALLWSVWSETGLASESLIQQMRMLKLGGISNHAGIRLFREELFKHGLRDPKVLFSPESTLRYGLEVNHE